MSTNLLLLTSHSTNSTRAPVVCKNSCTCNSKRFHRSLLTCCVLTLLCSLPNALYVFDICMYLHCVYYYAFLHRNMHSVCIHYVFLQPGNRGVSEMLPPAKRGMTGPTLLVGTLLHLQCHRAWGDAVLQRDACLEPVQGTGARGCHVAAQAEQGPHSCSGVPEKNPGACHS